MWSSSEYTAGHVAGGKVDSDRDPNAVESGYLSSANLLLSSEDLESEQLDQLDQPQAKPEAKPEAKLEPEEEPMKLDSGLDLGLSESLDILSINDLGVEKKPPSWEPYFLQDDDGDTQLHLAIAQGRAEVACALIRLAPCPAILDVANDFGQRPLHLCILAKLPGVARRLIAAGARPMSRDCRGNTPLHLASILGDAAAVRAIAAPVSPKEIIALGLRYSDVPRYRLDLEQRNYDGQMCVHLAAMGGHTEIIQHLVWLGADINAREGKSGYTPLHYAVENNNEKLTRFLLAECRQLKLEAPTYAGHTAIQVARGQRLVTLLMASGARIVATDSESEYDSDSDDEESYTTPARYEPRAIDASA